MAGPQQDSPRTSRQPYQDVPSVQHLQLVQRLPHERRQFPLVAVGHPTLECGLEDGDGDLGREARRRFAHPPLGQGLSQRGRQCGEFDQFALLQLDAGQNDALPLPRKLAPLLEHGTGRREGLAHRLEGSCRRGSTGDGADEQVLERPGTREQDLTLVG